MTETESEPGAGEPESAARTGATVAHLLDKARDDSDDPSRDRDS